MCDAESVTPHLVQQVQFAAQPEYRGQAAAAAASGWLLQQHFTHLGVELAAGGRGGWPYGTHKDGGKSGEAFSTDCSRV